LACSLSVPPPDEPLCQHVAGHTHSEGGIRLFLQLVLDAACSLRGASATMRLLGNLLPNLKRTPVANTGQLWLLRIGLFELTRPKEAADDWVWIVDHTVQIGVVKCLLIVGCRLSHWIDQRRPLEHRDLQVLTLQPVEKSAGATVYQQCEETCQRTGIVPRAIVSDEGTDLLGGIKAFCAEHSETVGVLDIAHQAAKLLKRELEGDARWAAFVGQAGGAKQRLAQTPLAHLLPPTPRSKARYMNLDELVTWGRKTLRYLDNPHPVTGQPLDLNALHAKLGWLADYRDALVEWSEVMTTIFSTLHYVRNEGYHQGAVKELRPLLATSSILPMSHRMATKLLAFVESQSALAKNEERLIGSSECIESLIGKGKRLEGQQSKSGFTKMILGMAAAVVEPTTEFLTEALATIKTVDVQDWCRQHLGISVQSQRRQALAPCGTKTG